MHFLLSCHISFTKTVSEISTDALDSKLEFALFTTESVSYLWKNAAYLNENRLDVYFVPWQCGNDINFSSFYIQTEKINPGNIFFLMKNYYYYFLLGILFLICKG
jgi:hypothetical protein